VAEIPSISIDEEVMFYDTDCGGVVHNIAYLRMIEKARTKLATLMGLALREMSLTHLFPVVVRTEIDYKRPAVLGDVITISGKLIALAGPRFWVEFQITRSTDAALLITCKQALALVQMPAGKPQRLPPEWAVQWPTLVVRATRQNGIS
jgi:YbgC/YbaW family acyl-CoA thioester hydrolase